MTTGTPLRILFLSIEYPPESPNGIGSYVVEVAAALARRGHEVHVLSCLPDQARRTYRDGDVWVHRRPRPRLRGLARVVRGARTAERIRHAIACWRETRGLGIDFDVVESPDWMAEGLIFALAGKPLVAHLHTPLAVTAHYGSRARSLDSRAAALLERLTVERARLVTAPSRLLADEVARRGWLKGREVRIIPYPIDAGPWALASPVASTPPRVLFTGRLEPRKAPEVLVEASARLAGDVDGIEVLLAGRSDGRRDGKPYGEWLARRIDDLGAPCRLLGEVPRPEVARLLSSSRVFVLPSRFENFPVAALEAMAAGRPVVCTTHTGLAELVEGSGAGAAVPRDDPDALARALRPYLADASVAAEAGARGQEVIRRTCSPDRIAEERERCYLAVARGSTA
ncbi:MAG: glycogen synthase [Solirubrobacteraceae bacterium]|nr:glycogen synthase [Solirubrobacteraceae bacterium]